MNWRALGVEELMAAIAGNEHSGERWPRLRTGERAYIPWYIRRAVYERDGGRCLSCGRCVEYREAQLDHIIPWSALGPDTSDNLRILCETCNTGRSNFRGSLDVWNARRTPVTFFCVNCLPVEYGLDYEDELDEQEAANWPETTVNAFCYRCGLVSPAWETW